MYSPIFNDAMFLGAAQMNAAGQTFVSGEQDDLGATHTPGLINPSGVTVTGSGLVLTFTCSTSFAALFGNGLLARAHGTTNGTDSQVYTVDFTSHVPSSGSQLIYVTLGNTTVAQQPFTVTGPPQGHPDNSPTFASYLAYAENYNTLTFNASITPPDNSTVIEFARVTLSAGQSTVLPSSLVYTSQVYAGSVLNHTGVAPATYTLLNGTVGADGRITSASSAYNVVVPGTLTVDSTTTIAGQLQANGGMTSTNIGLTGGITTPGGVNAGSGTITCGTINSTGVFNAPNTQISNGNVIFNGTFSTNNGSITASNGNFYATSGTVTAIDLTASNLVSGHTITSNGGMNNPWFSAESNGITLANTVISTGLLTAEGAITCYNVLTLYNTISGASGGWEAQIPAGGSSPALESNVGIVGGGTNYTVGTGYTMNTGGVGPDGGQNGTFGVITGYYTQSQAYFASSDVRLKENFDAILPEDGLRFVSSVHPTGFTWKESGERSAGYIAQQLVTAGFQHLVSALPHKDLASEEHEFDGVKITSKENVKLLAKYDEAIPYLHAAMRGLMSKLDAAMERISDLEDRISTGV